MESNIRRTGIDAIGDVPWGTHFCQFYETSQDLIEILVPYFKEGLASNEFCMWVTSEPLKVDQATAALREAVPNLNEYIDKGQIEILDYSQWYTRSGKFSADEVLQGWVDKLKAAQERGYEGLRLTGNTFWLEKADWDDFTKYEETVNSIIGQYPMLAICTYSLQKCNALELLDVVANHQFALIKRSDQWEIIESTQHKKIEQAMRESEEKLSALYASMVEGVALHEIIYDESENPVDYLITDINPSYEIITGLSREKALGQKASELYGLNEPPYLDIYARVASPGKPESFETYFPPMKKHFSISVFSPGRGKFATVFSDITERKQAEIGLQEANEELEVAGEELRQQNDELMSAQSALMDSEGRYRELVENANSIIIKMDQDGKITFFNDYSQKFFGYSLEEILGQNVKILVPPIESNGRNLEEMVDNILKNPNGFVENINENVRKNGDRVWISWRNKAIKDASGYIIGNLAVGQDITERKKMEDSLRESEERFRALAENIPDQITRFDRNLQLLYANPAVLQRTGLPEETLAGRTASEYGASPKAADHFEKVAREVLESGEPRRYEHTSLWHGETRVLDAQIVPERDADGTVRAVIAIARDITERKRAEEALQASEQRYVTTLASIGDAVIATDIKGRISFMNAVAEDLTGWSLGEASQKPSKAVFNIINEYTRQKVDDPITKVLENGAIVGLANHTILIRKDGTEVAIDDSGAPIKDRDGDITGIVLVFRDITERKRLEDKLRESGEKYRTAIDFTCDWETWQSPEGNYIYVSPSCEHITGYSADAFLTDPEFIESIVHPEDRELFPRHLNNVDDAQPVDFRIIGRNGEERWISHVCQPVYGSDGRYLGRRASNRDITDQKRSEEALRETRDYLENLINYANAPIIPLSLTHK